MKFSESWLRSAVNPSISIEELVAQVTMAGLEVDAVESAAPEMSGVVVGEILSVEQHPDADKLRVCQVAGGGETAQVVCGAPNARAGIKVPFATVGAKLPGDFKIKKAKLRGVESFGMLCAQTELQLGDDDDGLWELPADASVGSDLIEYLELNDNIIEVDLTPNRGDCLSIRGLAREVGVLNKTAVLEQACAPVTASINDSISITLEAPEACARYVGRVVRNLDLRQPTPQWMQEKLRRSGVRSLGPAVDVTNYVLLELGQPMHAFDLSKIDGGIVVRMGRDEKVKLLDDSDVVIDTQTLVIADQSKALAMAGIMGGDESAVGDDTTDILFESAWFNPLAIAGKARNYGKHTDSSHRFERGVDSELQVAAIERATALMLEICGGEAGPVVIQESAEHLPAPATIKLRDAHLAQQLGVVIGSAEIDDILARLGLTFVSRDDEGSTWVAPSWRFDIAIEQDLVEEVARIYGYNNLPTSTPTMALELQAKPERQQDLSIFRQQLVASGYQEAVTYSFVDPELQKLVDPETDGIALQNPISADMSVMRTSLWSGLLSTAIYNLNRQQNRVRIFEAGQCFVPGENGELTQNMALAGLICGSRTPAGWTASKDKVDFFDIKGDLESVLALTGLAEQFSFSAAEHPALHPGQSAMLSRNGEQVGWIGQLHPKLQAQLDVSTPVYLFQVDVAKVSESRLPKFSEVSKFPAVRRDLAFLVDSQIASADLMSEARNAAGEHLVDLMLFDVYQSKDIDNKGKSLALGLTFQHASRTLTDEEINTAIDRVVKKLDNKFKAELRG
ncbi:phenylalanyl-tRNA synthetase beta subunit [marine gamma proteobacterium HTCC2207]|uniref:Phenylalanine--tRNA ligase beta subunit n=1 Tax=gamma proteobacterium HTCC2207 TaxID=314287 RepID=Q1YPK7_9GAMM|nr:phenylalanyl-tRNA synthetase beta subunit [marine gamma proteobacterium HTCC2207] [gamma proteobacterium HTCC2207]